MRLEPININLSPSLASPHSSWPLSPVSS
jgi:hypothetical protein